MVEEMFGPYRLRGLLGQGGMGEVWRAGDTRKDDREIAVKVLGAALGADPEFARRFRREAALAARLNVPNIVPVHDYGEIDGRLFIEMPLIPGDDLGRLVAREGPLTAERAVGIVSQLGRALSALHRAGLVHRDVKPSNVLVTDVEGDDHVYLIDFGIARSLDGTRTLTAAGIGTPAYMAPEQFAGGGDRRADIYALGCVLYEALTGFPPFAGDNPVALMYSHVNVAPPRPSSSRPELPAALDDVVVRAMDKDPDRRHDSVAEFTRAARDALVPQAGVMPRPDASDPPAEPAAGGHVDQQPRSGRRPAETEDADVTTPDRPEAGAAPHAVTLDAGPDPRSTPRPAAATAADGPPEVRNGPGAPATVDVRPPEPQPPDRPDRRHRRWVLGAFAGVLLLVAGLITVVLLRPARPLDLTLTGHSGYVTAVATTVLDGRPVVVSGGQDRTIRVWDAAEGTPIGTPITGHTDPVRALTTAELDGRQVIVSGGYDSTIRVWDLATHAPVGAPISRGENTYVYSLTTTPLDGRTVIVAGDSSATLQVFDLATHAAVGTPFTSPADYVTSTAAAQLNGRTVIISSEVRTAADNGDDGAIRVWDLATHAAIGAPIVESEYAQSVTAAELDGRTVIVADGDGGTARVWDLATRAAIGTPIGGGPDPVSDVTTATIGGRPLIVTGGANGAIRLWDLATHTGVGTPIPGHTRAVSEMATAEVDGRLVIASTGDDKTLRVQEPLATGFGQ